MLSIEKKYLRICAYGLVFLLISYQFYALFRANRIIETYEMNSTSAYIYVSSFTDFELFAQEIEELYDTQEVSDDKIVYIANLLDRTTLHLMQLNSLRVPNNRKRYPFNNTFTFGASEGTYVFKFAFLEQYEFHNLINNVWMSLHMMLNEISREGVHQNHREILSSLNQNIREMNQKLQNTRGTSFNRIDNYKHFNKQFNHIYGPLERMEDSLSSYL